jgi:transposase-like protein
MPQERRSYSKCFKAQVVVEYAQADTSIDQRRLDPQPKCEPCL